MAMKLRKNKPEVAPINVERVQSAPNPAVSNDTNEHTEEVIVEAVEEVEEEPENNIATYVKESAPSKNQVTTISIDNPLALEFKPYLTDAPYAPVKLASMERLASKIQDYVHSISQHVEPTFLYRDQRSSQVLIPNIDEFEVGENSTLYRYQNTNIVVFNDICSEKQIDEFLDKLIASPDKELEIYDHNPTRRILNDIELNTLLAASNGAIVEVKRYSNARELIYHGVIIR